MNRKIYKENPWWGKNRKGYTTMRDDTTAPLDQILFDDDDLDGALDVLNNPASGSLDTF